MDTYLRRLKEECDFVNMCVSVSYPRMREIILEVISECGISYSNISYNKYDDNVYMLILNNCEVNIQQFINATNSNVEIMILVMLHRLLSICIVMVVVN